MTLRTALIGAMALSVVALSAENADARSRRRVNDGAAVGAAIALGALAIGAAAIASQDRSTRGSEFIGYDDWGNPVYAERYYAPRNYEPRPRYYEEPAYGYEGGYGYSRERANRNSIAERRARQRAADAYTQQMLPGFRPENNDR